MSVVHFHYDGGEHVDGIEHQISQVTNECAICASHFKVTPGSDHESDVTLHFSTQILVLSDKIIVDPLNNVQNGRAPPFTV